MTTDKMSDQKFRLQAILSDQLFKIILSPARVPHTTINIISRDHKILVPYWPFLRRPLPWRLGRSSGGIGAGVSQKITKTPDPLGTQRKTDRY